MANFGNIKAGNKTFTAKKYMILLHFSIKRLVSVYIALESGYADPKRIKCYLIKKQFWMG